MAGMLSLRVSKSERRQLQMLRAEKGHANLSVTMRVLMGFPERTPDGEPLMEGSDDIESVAQLCRLVVQMIDRQDELIKQNTLIARHVGIPRDPSTGAVAAAIANGTPLEYRGGAKHPNLPEGFSRG